MPNAYHYEQMAGRGEEIGHSNNTIAPWSSFYDETEENTQLAWPHGLKIYDRMRRGDVQISSSLLTVTLPLRRRRWMLAQEDASDTVTEFCANEYSLPIRGKDPVKQVRRHNRFSHDYHLRHALLRLVYGHMFFEQVYAIGDDQLAHVRKLPPRMPRSIAEIKVETDGGLKAIKQYPAGSSGGSGLILPSNGGLTAPEIPVNKLVAYVQDLEGSSWYGQSSLRPIYGNWAIKDRLVRVDALKHERNGLGIPMIEAPEGASQKMLIELGQMAMAYKAGDKSGGALPFGAKLQLVGTTGSVPDTLASIRYHDQQIAKAWLEWFTSLGTTETGSRALGDSLMEFFSLGLDAIAGEHEDVFSEHVLEDLVQLNWGDSEPAPRLVSEPVEDEQLSAADLATFIKIGLLDVEPELQEWARDNYNIDYKPSLTAMPEKKTESKPDPDPEIDDVAEEEEEEEDTKAAAAVRPSGPLALNEGFSREPFPHEIAAATNFDAIDQIYESIVAVLVAEWGQVRASQLDDLAAQIEQAGGDLEVLAAITAAAAGVEVLTPRLIAAAQQGAAGATGEAVAQGVVMTVPQIDEDVVRDRAKAVELVMARSLGEVASRKAIEFTSPEVQPAAVAIRVREHIEGLSDTFTEDQFGGAVTTAQNHGRFTVFEEEPPRELYASEIRDRKTCKKCKAVDGKKYVTVAEAKEDYSLAGYDECLGGPRCRGTAVGIWSDESAASV